MKTKSKDQVHAGIDQRVVKALAHPIRVRVLALLNQKVASPSELAEEMGEPLGNVSYHVRTLLDLGCIELVRTAPRRGAVEHYYKAVTRPIFSDEDWAEMPTSLRRSVAGTTLTEIWRDIDAAARNGGFDADATHLKRTPLSVDSQGRRDLAAELGRLIERALEIQAESAKRLEKADDGESQRVQLVTMLFEADSGAPQKPAKSGSGKRRARSNNSSR